MTDIPQLEPGQPNYFMQVTHEEAIDPADDTGLARFLNHAASGKGNCKTRVEVVGNEWRVFLYSTKEILPGTELLYGYNMVHCEEPWAQEQSKVFVQLAIGLQNFVNHIIAARYQEATQQTSAAKPSCSGENRKK